MTGDLKSVSQSRYSTVYDPSQRKVDTFHPPGKTHSLSRLLKFGGHQKSFCEREREREREIQNKKNVIIVVEERCSDGV